MKNSLKALGLAAAVTIFGSLGATAAPLTPTSTAHLTRAQENQVVQVRRGGRGLHRGWNKTNRGHHYGWRNQNWRR